MKNIPFKLKGIALVVLLFLVNSCKKEFIADFGYGIEPNSQLSLLCKSLRLLGNNKDGKMPSGKGASNSLIVSYPRAVEISAGVLLFIPYRVNNVNNVCKIYLQVAGADNYWETKLTLDPTSKQPYFQILIPRFIKQGRFDFVYSLEDCSGNISPSYNTRTVVSPLSDCNTSISGSVGITVRTFDLGDKAGKAGFIYDMYTIPDRLDIRYDGKWVASTGKIFDDKVIIPDCSGNSDGFVSGVGVLGIDYDPSKSRIVEVYISGCNDGTKWDVTPRCPQNLPLIGVHTSVSSNWFIQNVWDHGHAWITITENGKTQFYGLWPDNNDLILAAKLNNGTGTDVRKNFENGAGRFSRYKYIELEKMSEVSGFINKHWEYDLFTRNCSTFAQKVWKVSTGEELNASEFLSFGATESPRKLGNSIILLEKVDPTAFLQPIAREANTSNSFKK
jgi:hypothetical protein